MFKGISEEFKEKLERFNRETEFFCFNCSDLELGSYIGDKDKKSYLYSDELKRKLNKIIQELKKPEENIPTLRSFLFSHFLPYSLWIAGPIYDFNWWLIFPKDSIYQMAKRGKEQGKNGFLVYEGEGEMHSIATLPYFFFGDIRFKEEDLINQFRDKINQSLRLVWNEINQAIFETNINISDLEINYLELLPDNCRCEVEVNLDGTLKNSGLWESHINNCLGRTEGELTEFKKQMLAQIQQGKNNFSNCVSSIISEIEDICKEKRVKADSIWSIGDWKEVLRNSCSHQNLQFWKKVFLENVENLAKGLTKAAEEELRRENQAKADRLRQEKTERKRRRAEEKFQQEQKETKQQEERKNKQKQQEDHIKKHQEEKQKKRHHDPNSKLTVAEVREEVRRDLNQELLTNRLQRDDLPEEFRNWTEKLEGLKSKEEIYLYQDFILNSIAKIVEERNINIQEQPKTTSSWLDNLLILGGIFSLSLFLFFFLKKLTKK